MTGRHTKIYDLRVVVEEFRDLYCEDCAESSNVSFNWVMPPRVLLLARRDGSSFEWGRPSFKHPRVLCRPRDTKRRQRQYETEREPTGDCTVANCRFHETRDQLFWQHRALGGVFG